MSNAMEQLDQAVLANLRNMAQQGRSPSEMLRALRRSVGPETHIVTLLNYFRQAFGLTLADVKPIAALSRNEQREIEDEALLNEILVPAISRRRADGETSKP
jgi:hypothetical protein